MALLDHQGLQASMEDPVPPIEVRVQGHKVPSLPVILADGESLDVILPEPLPERVPRGAWAFDSFHRLHYVAFPPKRSKAKTTVSRLLLGARDRAGRALRTGAGKSASLSRSSLSCEPAASWSEGRSPRSRREHRSLGAAGVGRARWLNAVMTSATPTPGESGTSRQHGRPAWTKHEQCGLDARERSYAEKQNARRA